MRETGKAVWIIRPKQGSSEFELNTDGLEQLFGGSDVCNTLLALYSIAGAFRKGKSFLINFFLRYFYSEQSPDWIQTGSRNLKAYFNWKGGVHGDTQGLVIWSQPFILEHDGKQIALFLMDSQGSFDLRKKSDQSTKIFALSALLSSMQIFNITENVSAADGEHLQLVAKYGKFAREQQDSCGSDQHKSLQNLQFLIRDWSAPDQYAYGGRGGRDYLHEVVFAKHNSADVRQIERDVTNEFDRVSCFLMPNPGPAVATRAHDADPNSLLLTEVGQEFLRHVDKLVDVLFSPGNVVPKQVNGNPITCLDFINLTHSYFHVLHSDRMPEIHSIYEATAMTTLQKAVETCVEQYAAAMDEMAREVGYLPDEDLLTMVAEEKCKVVEEFDRQSKFGSEQLQQEYRQHLEQQLDQQLAIVLQNNAKLLEHLKDDCRKAVDESFSTYKIVFQDLVNEECVEEEQLHEFHEVARETALSVYDNYSPRCNTRMQNQYVAELNGAIERDFQQSFMEMQCLKADMIGRLKNLVLSAKEVYKLTMTEKLSDAHCSDDAFEAAHDEAEAAASATFESGDTSSLQALVIEKRRELYESLLEEKNNFLRVNRTNKKLADAEIVLLMTDIKERYHANMMQALGATIAETSEVDEAHEKCMMEAVCYITSLEHEKGQLVVDRCWQVLDEVLLEEKRKLTTGNLQRKVKNSIEIKTLRNTFFRKYKQEMDERTADRFTPDRDMTLRHKFEFAEALRLFDENSPTQPADEYESAKAGLKDDIQEYYAVVVDRNANLQSRSIEHAKLIEEEIKCAYLEEMRRFCSGRFVDPSELRRKHDAWVRDLAAKIGDDARASKFIDVEKVSLALDNLFQSEVAKNNVANKKFNWRRAGERAIVGFQSALRVGRVVYEASSFIPNPTYRAIIVVAGSVIGFAVGFFTS